MHYLEYQDASSSYIGFPNGLWCNGPLTTCDCYTEPMSDPSYSCPREGIPGWDPSWYSPICRGWYMGQQIAFEDEPNSPREFISDIYMMMGNNRAGLTATAPIQIYEA